MINIDVKGTVFLRDGKTEDVNFFKSRFEKTSNAANSTVAGRVSALGKFFTSHIKEKLKNNKPTGGNPNPNATARLVTEPRLVTMQDAKDGLYTFKYTFPKNAGTEYGYPLGSAYSFLGGSHKKGFGGGLLAKWIMDKGGFTYTNKGKTVVITKRWQAASVAWIMQEKGKGKKRKFNVPFWYKISFDDNIIKDKLNEYRELYHYTWIKKWNNA